MAYSNPVQKSVHRVLTTCINLTPRLEAYDDLLDNANCPVCLIDDVIGLLERIHELCKDEVQYMDEDDQAKEMAMADPTELTSERYPRIVAPWTDALVQILRWHQTDSAFHPYTCPDDATDLIPFTDGFRCPNCDYTQDWAWDFMIEEGFLKSNTAKDPTP